MDLDSLTKSGDIVSWKLETLDESGNVKSDGSVMRETDRLTLILPSGRGIVIDTFCSGCLENTSVHVKITEPESDFQKWWNENKVGVCHDIRHHLNMSQVETNDLLLMHIAAQAWVAAQMK